MTEQEQWSETWSRLGATAPDGLLTELVARYSEPHRFYHTLQHLRECFSVLDSASHLAGRLAEVQLALWFHDAFYDTHAQNNEEQSAQWAEESLIPAVLARMPRRRSESLCWQLNTTLSQNKKMRSSSWTSTFLS